MAVTKSVDVKISDEARQAFDKGVLDGNWSGQDLLILLRDVEKWDAKVEIAKARGKRLFSVGCIGMVVGLIAFFFVIATIDEPTPMLWVAAPVLLILVGLAVWGHRMKKAALKIDVPDEVRLCFTPVLRQLLLDLHPSRKVRAQLNLRAMDDDRPKETRTLTPVSCRSHTCDTYEEPLGSLRMPLADGTTAVLEIQNDFEKHTRKKVNSRGKHKTKYKWKKYTHVTCSIIPASADVKWDRIRALRTVNPRQEELSFPEKDGVTRAKMYRFFEYRKLGEAPADTVDPKVILKMFVCLNLLQTKPKQGAAHS